MPDDQAIHQSKQLIDNGYADWLTEQIKNLAVAKFANADPADIHALSQARVVMDMAAEVRQIVFSCARDSKKLP